MTAPDSVGPSTPPSNQTVVTVAICTFNRADVLRQTLEGLKDLEIPAGVDWEVLVVDNKSTDHTPDVLKAMTGVLPIRAERELNTGQSYARNLILRKARGSFILWTDDDALVNRTWLTTILSTFSQTGADFVFGKVEPAWPNDRTPDWYSTRVSGLFALIDYGDQSFVATDPHKSFAGVNFAGRIEAHRRLGDFRVDYGVRGNQTGGGLGEDTDMYERALAAGMKVVYEPNAVVRHIIPDVRARKMFNWKKALFNQRRFYENLVADPPSVPWLLGLPRYYYRNMLDDTGALLKALATGDKPKRFFHELYVLRFVGLFAQSWRHRFRRLLRMEGASR